MIFKKIKKQLNMGPETIYRKKIGDINYEIVSCGGGNGYVIYKFSEGMVGRIYDHQEIGTFKSEEEARKYLEEMFSTKS